MSEGLPREALTATASLLAQQGRAIGARRRRAQEAIQRGSMGGGYPRAEVVASPGEGWTRRSASGRVSALRTQGLVRATLNEVAEIIVSSSRLWQDER